jgi:pimeloyl-ACP methyl ester carboxylesterase
MKPILGPYATACTILITVFAALPTLLVRYSVHCDPRPFKKPVDLPDGLSGTVGYRLYGRRDARHVVLHMHDFPGSRLDMEQLLSDDMRMQIDDGSLLIVAIDRPGFGLSRYSGDASVLAATIRVVRGLTKKLGIERFGVMGHGAGGPFAAACLTVPALRSRVTAVLLVSSYARFPNASGLAPIDRVASVRPALVQRTLVAVLAQMVLSPMSDYPPDTPCEPSTHATLMRILGVGGADARACAERPRELGALLLGSTAEALRCGGAGLGHDATLWAHTPSWGYGYGHVQDGSRLVVYHGTDARAPLAHGRHWHEHVPGSQLFLGDGEGSMSGTWRGAMAPAWAAFIHVMDAASNAAPSEAATEW